jgi:hypothetical protein
MSRSIAPVDQLSGTVKPNADGSYDLNFGPQLPQRVASTARSLKSLYIWGYN